MSKFDELRKQGEQAAAKQQGSRAAPISGVVPTLDINTPSEIPRGRAGVGEVLRRTLRVPAHLAAAARAERDDLEVTLTDVIMMAAGQHAADLRSEAEPVGQARLGGAEVLRRRRPSVPSGDLAPIQWLGTQDELRALDDLVAGTGFSSRNALVTEVLHRRFGPAGE